MGAQGQRFLVTTVLTLLFPAAAAGQARETYEFYVTAGGMRSNVAANPVGYGLGVAFVASARIRIALTASQYFGSGLTNMYFCNIDFDNPCAAEPTDVRNRVRIAELALVLTEPLGSHWRLDFGFGFGIGNRKYDWRSRVSQSVSNGATDVFQGLGVQAALARRVVGPLHVGLVTRVFATGGVCRDAPAFAATATTTTGVGCTAEMKAIQVLLRVSTRVTFPLGS